MLRLASALATLVAGLALALVVAYWGWQLLGPSAVHLPMPAPSDPAATIVASDLFHGARSRTPPDAPALAILRGDARLLGIVAEGGARGYALFRLPDGARLVAPGDEITSGATLVDVRPDAITVRDGAGEHRLLLRPEVSSARSPAPAAPAPSGAPAGKRTVATSTCAPPAGFRGNVVRLNTELLGGLAGDAGPWRTLLASIPGGLEVREDGGFGAMLGLKSGDRIVQANGIALAVPDDVASAVVRPLIANQGVRVVGSREGKTQELWLANVACAG